MGDRSPGQAATELPAAWKGGRTRHVRTVCGGNVARVRFPPPPPQPFQLTCELWLKRRQIWRRLCASLIRRPLEFSRKPRRLGTGATATRSCRGLHDVHGLAQNPQRPAPHEDPPNYPIADVIASQNTVKSPKNWCGPCTITCSLRKFPAESNVTTNEKNPTSSTKVLLWEV